MEEYYTRLATHRYQKGYPTILIMDNSSSEIEKTEIKTTIQIGFKSQAKKTLKAIANHLLSGRTDRRVTCFHINYKDGTELVLLPSFFES